MKLNSHIPVNWMGSYVYVDGLQLKASLPRFVFDYDLILYYNDDIVGKQIIISESDMDNNIGRFNSPFLMLPEKGHEDIKLYRLNSHFKRGQEKYTPLSYVASEKFYTRVWKDAIRSQHIKFFKLKSSFSAKKIDSVIKELQSILDYGKIKYGEKSLENQVLKETISQLIFIIEEERNLSTKFYIL